MPRRKGTKSRSELGTPHRILAGHFGTRIPRVKKDIIQEQALKLVKTMRNPGTTEAGRKAAREKLSEIITEEEAKVKEERDWLSQHKAKKLEKGYLPELNMIEVRQAELDIIKALFNGAKPESTEMKILVKRANNLREKRKRLLGTR